MDINIDYLYLYINKTKNIVRKTKEAPKMKIKTYLIQVNIAKLKSENYSNNNIEEKGRRFL